MWKEIGEYNVIGLKKINLSKTQIYTACHTIIGKADLNMIHVQICVEYPLSDAQNQELYPNRYNPLP